MEQVNDSIDNAKRMTVHLKPDVQRGEDLTTEILARKCLDIVEWLCDYLELELAAGFYMLVERFTCSSFSVQRLDKPSMRSSAFSSAFSLLLSPSSHEEGVPDRWASGDPVPGDS